MRTKLRVLEDETRARLKRGPLTSREILNGISFSHEEFLVLAEMVRTDWFPDHRYYVLAPNARMAEDILRVDHHIHPRLPLIRYTVRPDTLVGYRNIRVLLLDPHREFNDRDRACINELYQYAGMVDWTEKDFTYLKGITDGRITLPG